MVDTWWKLDRLLPDSGQRLENQGKRNTCYRKVGGHLVGTWWTFARLLLDSGSMRENHGKRNTCYRTLGGFLVDAWWTFARLLPDSGKMFKNLGKRSTCYRKLGGHLGDTWWTLGGHLLACYRVQETCTEILQTEPLLQETSGTLGRHLVDTCSPAAGFGGNARKPWQTKRLFPVTRNLADA